MRNKILKQLTIGLLSFSILIAPFTAIVEATDLPSEVSFEHKAYLNGYKDNTIKPENNVSREEVAAMLDRTLDFLYESNDINFKDLNKNRWSYKHISKAYNVGIIQGYPGNVFKPTADITRAEAVTMLMRYRYGDNINITVSNPEYKNHWAGQAIQKALDDNIIKGYPDGSFKPNNKITRAEFVTMLNNMTGRFCSINDIRIINKYKDLNNSKKWYYTDMIRATNTHTFKWKPILPPITPEEKPEIDKDDEIVNSAIKEIQSAAVFENENELIRFLEALKFNLPIQFKVKTINNVSSITISAGDVEKTISLTLESSLSNNPKEHEKNVNAVIKEIENRKFNNIDEMDIAIAQLSNKYSVKIDYQSTNGDIIDIIVSSGTFIKKTKVEIIHSNNTDKEDKYNVEESSKALKSIDTFKTAQDMVNEIIKVKTKYNVAINYQTNNGIDYNITIQSGKYTDKFVLKIDKSIDDEMILSKAIIEANKIKASNIDDAIKEATKIANNYKIGATIRQVDNKTVSITFDTISGLKKGTTILLTK